MDRVKLPIRADPRLPVRHGHHLLTRVEPVEPDPDLLVRCAEFGIGKK